MKPVSKTIDVNAHIKSLKSDVICENGIATAHVSFENIGYGVITAIKFNAVGFNSFGDIVPIGGKDKFFLIIQDICVQKNGSAVDLKAKLPNPDIRKLEIEENQICCQDGTVFTYAGKEEHIFEVEQFDPADSSESEKVVALQSKFGESFTYLPKELDNGWICGCGCYNSLANDKCIGCQVTKADASTACNPDTLCSLIENYKIAENQRKETELRECQQKEKENKKKKIIYAISAVVAIVIAFLIGHAVVLSGRTTYSSSDEMMAAVAGTYTRYNDITGNASCQLIIADNKVTIVWGMDREMENEVKEWNYKEGTFTTFEKYIVLSNGDIKDDDGDVYEKGGYMSSGNTSLYSSYSSGDSDLKITADSCSTNSSYTICTGSVKNNGTKTYSFIEVMGAFKGSNGNVIATDWTYAAGSEGLAPGESTTFRLSVDKNYDIKSCSVSLLDYD